jgi:HD-GYP domain-containing protein (c-di-GMP phosphodiesterase class II)
MELRLSEVLSALSHALDRRGPARVLAVADVAEALSAHRPYRNALEPDEVLAIMAREAGTTLDAEVFEALVELMTKPQAAASHHAA